MDEGEMSPRFPTRASTVAQLNIRVTLSEGAGNTAIFGARMFMLDGVFK